MNLIQRLWNGDVSLVKTYWIYWVLAWLVMSFMDGFFTGYYGEEGPNKGFILFCFAYAVFINISLWKSATKYEGPAFWAVIVKASVAIPFAIFGTLILITLVKALGA